MPNLSISGKNCLPSFRTNNTYFTFYLEFWMKVISTGEIFQRYAKSQPIMLKYIKGHLPYSDMLDSILIFSKYNWHVSLCYYSLVRNRQNSLKYYYLAQHYINLKFKLNALETGAEHLNFNGRRINVLYSILTVDSFLKRKW